MEDIIIIGGGGLAREIKFLIQEINHVSKLYNFVGYLVSDLNKPGKYDSTDEILGDLSWLTKNPNINLAIGIGNPKYRLKIGKEITSRYPHVKLPSLIHPNVVYDHHTCKFERGSIVCSSSALTVNINIKEFALVNLGCTIGHEVVIGRGCVLNPTVNVSGGVKIYDGVLIGTGVQILQYLEIGEFSTVGSGACVTKNVVANDIVLGIPAKPIQK